MSLRYLIQNEKNILVEAVAEVYMSNDTLRPPQDPSFALALHTFTTQDDGVEEGGQEKWIESEKRPRPLGSTPIDIPCLQAGKSR